MNFLKLLRTAEPASADLRRELAGLDIPGKAKTIANVQATRRSMLLDGEVGDALDRVERELTEAQREHDRAVALDEELRVRLAQAEQRERVDALMARKAAAEKESREVAKLMETRFPVLVAEMVKLRDRNAASFIECTAVDEALAAIGTTERVTRTTSTLDAAARHAESVIFRF